MVLPRDFDGAAHRAVALADLTSLGVGGRPEYLFEPTTEVEARAVLLRCRRHGVPVRVLGGGTNVLVGDGVIDGAVVLTRGLRDVEVEADRVEVGAGFPFPHLVRRAADLRVPGLSGCPGIPGTVGGAVCMNAGGRHGSVEDALVEVHLVELDGTPRRCIVRPGDMGYRWSPFEGSLVTRAVFRRDPELDPAAARSTRARALAEKRDGQPLGARSAGCTFRNPDGLDGAKPAGLLIERAGLKGRRVGGAAVSDVHANFIVNDGSASAADVQELIRCVQQEVRDVHGVELELEVRLWS